ncbi:MAG: hypothetical protein GYB36_10635 [Alphaproteobacteria bacterium]|nr:hypothetical protein [Alphaproteobacteria bacterium]
MSLFQLFRRRNLDLFGDPIAEPVSVRNGEADLALSLRRLSEDAVAAGLDRASCLIEIAAMIVELEDAYRREGCPHDVVGEVEIR